MPDSAEEAIDVTLTVAARLGVAALVLVCGYVLAVVARRFVRRLLARPDVAKAIGPSMARLLSSTVFYLILALAVGRSLVALGVSETFVSMVTLVAIALIALALNQSIANFAATVVFLFFQPFRRGDWVETMGHFGAVQEILLFNTVILLPDQRIVSLPNSKIQESGVTNYSQMGSVQASFTLTVAYREDLDHVRRVIDEVAAQDRRILPDPPFAVFVDDLGETGVRMLIFPTVRPEHYLAVRNDLRERIKARFDAEGIAFAVPRREVHMAEVQPPEPADGGAPPRHPSAGRSAASTEEQVGRADPPVDRGKATRGDGRSRRPGGSNEERGA